VCVGISPAGWTIRWSRGVWCRLWCGLRGVPVLYGIRLLFRCLVVVSRPVFAGELGIRGRGRASSRAKIVYCFRDQQERVVLPSQEGEADVKLEFEITTQLVGPLVRVDSFF
jgi:hypothetical protein